MQVQKTNESKTITIYDIAKEAGVSAATVSRVLTNNANVRREKKEKILQIIEKYNFKPNALARGLADTKSRVIGIVVADIRNPYYSELFISCEKAAREAGYTVLMTNSLNQMELEESALEKLQEQRVEAIILLGGRVDDLVSNMDFVELVNQAMASTPVVITGKLDGTKCRMVRIDSMKAMEILMEYLLSLGHRRIALVGGSAKVLSTYEKLLCYKQILKQNSIPFDPELIAGEGGYDESSGYRLMGEMLDKGIVPTAVVAINDYAAAGVYHAIVERGYKIPEDISVVGYDNTFMTNLMIPRLTSVDYHYDEFGYRLVQTAIRAIEGQECELLQTVTPELVCRESCGPARER